MRILNGNTHPETNIIDLDSLPQQLISKTQLPESLNRLRLQAVRSSCDCFVRPFIHNYQINAISCQIAPCKVSIAFRLRCGQEHRTYNKEDAIEGWLRQKETKKGEKESLW